MYKNSDSKDTFCSFCEKSQDQVDFLIAGPQVEICNECVNLCNIIIQDKKRELFKEMSKND